MSTVTRSAIPEEVDYPTGDGRPMAETPVHRDNLNDTIATIDGWYAARSDVYVSGNMFVYYEKGNRYKGLAPDVFVVLGVPRTYRDIYKTWEEPHRHLDLVIEFTSRSTSEEDLVDKFEIFRDIIRVREYLLFDPYREYLVPSERLFRLRGSDYLPVAPVDGRLPSEVLGLHFERDDRRLRLYNPQTGLWLPTPREEAAEARSALKATESALASSASALASIESALASSASALAATEAERDRLAAEKAELLREIEHLRSRTPPT